jgi:hypothetical protein
VKPAGNRLEAGIPRGLRQQAQEDAADDGGGEAEAAFATPTTVTIGPATIT